MLDVGCSTFGDYATLDFARPIHGYLTLEITDARAGTVWEIGYNELATNPRDLTPLLTPDGHFDPEFTCGSPFGDRVILRGGPQTITLPEERTWRYLLIHQTTMNSEQGSVNSEQGAVPNPSDPLFTAHCPLFTDHCSLLTAIFCRVSQHPVTQTGTFNLPHPSTFNSTTLQPLIRLCLDHARITMSDTYVDTTGREDAQWLEDIQYRARLAATWFGDTTLRQVTLRHAVEQQDPQTSLFRVFAPEDYASSGCQFLDWGMTWIGLLHDDWQWTGSTQLLRRYYPALKKFLTALKHLITPDGLLTGHNCLADNHGSARLDHTNLGDAPGYESIPNTWYYGYLQQSAEIADAIGETTDATDYRQRATQLRNAFQRFITRDASVSLAGRGVACDARARHLRPSPAYAGFASEAPTCGASVPPAGNAEPQLGTQCRPLGHATLGDTIAELWTPARGPHAYGQAAVVNAIFHGLIPDRATARAMLQTAFPAPDGIPPLPSPIKRWNTPTTIYRALRVLCEHDLGPLAAAHLAATYAPHLPDGPLPEYFLPGPTRQPVDPTGSHGWAAVPLTWLHDTVLGVRYHHTTKSSPAHIVIKPHYVGWDAPNGTVMTPSGPITVHIDWPAHTLDANGPEGVPIIKQFLAATPISPSISSVSSNQPSIHTTTTLTQHTP